jgi:hypothetical protein
MSDLAFEGAEKLRSLAETISLNAANGFGGAVIIIPPAGDPRDLVFLSGKIDPNFFWAQVINFVNVITAEVDDEKRRNAGGFF